MIKLRCRLLRLATVARVMIKLMSINFKMQNSMAVFTFPILNWELSFLANLVQKIKNCQFKLKFGSKTKSDMLNLMMIFTFSVANWKRPFLGKFGPRNQELSVYVEIFYLD